jgi:hypothetical protein
MPKIHWGSLIVGIAVAFAVAWAMNRRRVRNG